MSNAVMSLHVSGSGSELLPLYPSSVESGLSVLSIETSTPDVLLICGSLDRAYGVDVGRVSDARALSSSVAASFLVGNESLRVVKSEDGLWVHLCNVSNAHTNNSVVEYLDVVFWGRVRNDSVGDRGDCGGIVC